MITKDSLTRERLGLAACGAMVAINLGIVLIALIVAFVDDGPPRSRAGASSPTPPIVNEASYAIPPNPAPGTTESPRTTTAEAAP